MIQNSFDLCKIKIRLLTLEGVAIYDIWLLRVK